jgi:hypothetical protein
MSNVTLSNPAFDPTVASQLTSLDPNWRPDQPSNLSANIRASYAVLKYRGKVWRIAYQGNEQMLMVPSQVPGQPPQPMQSIELVIVDGSPAISKIYYPNRYVEGSKEKPLCWSSDGVRPDSAVPPNQRQASACAVCPMNAWGSKITENGKQAKACQDSRRVAVVPVSDVRNAAFGGPVLLRIPPASLIELARFDAQMASLGFPTHGVAVHVSFDPTAAYPKLRFTPSRPLTPDEFVVVMEHRNGPVLRDVLAASISEHAVHEEPVAAMPSAAPTMAPIAQPVPRPAAPGPRAPGARCP